MRLDLVVGPNGAGKTTLVRKVLLPVLPPATVFVNADEIARLRWPEDPEGKSYEAAQVAAQTRHKLLEAGHPFIAETVFSHPSKLELVAAAREAGYHVHLHVLLVPEDLTVRRVELRVAAGGHSVPEEKVRGRYSRLWALVRAAIDVTDAATVYDTTGHDATVVVAQFTRGVLVGQALWPEWTPAELRA